MKIIRTIPERIPISEEEESWRWDDRTHQELSAGRRRNWMPVPSSLETSGNLQRIKAFGAKVVNLAMQGGSIKGW